MKISSIEAIPLVHRSANQAMTFFAVRITTDDGNVGWGESCDSFGISHPFALAAIVDRSYAPLLIGRELQAVSPLIDELLAVTGRSLGGYSGAAQALSAVEIALWDIVAAASGRSVSSILGRVRDSIPVYVGSSPFLESGPATYHYDLLAPAFSRGVRMVKMRIGHDWERALTVLAELRGLVGDEIEIATDGSEFFNTADALLIARRLASLGVTWFEEPIEHTKTSAIAALVARSPVPIAYGEHLFSPTLAMETLSATRLGVVQPDASIAGGIVAARSVAAIGESLAARIAIHHHAGAVSMAANLQVAATLTSASVFEYPAHLSPILELVAPEAGFGLESIVDGQLRIPELPGLGVLIDEEAQLSGRIS
jgi:L-alanine-DL-glutamate epimerase-like enolase superfamily enzyme